MGRYEQNGWRHDDGSQGPRSYDRDERYGRPRMQWENDQARGMRNEPHQGASWREADRDRYPSFRGPDEYQRAMVRPEDRGWDDHREHARDDDFRSPRSYDRDRQALSAWEREPGSLRRDWYGAEHRRDEYDHYQGHAHVERQDRGRSFETSDGRGRYENGRYDGGGYDRERPQGRAPMPREHRPEDDFGKVRGRFDEERYSGSVDGRSDRPSSRVSPDGYGMRMVRPGDRPSHDRSNDDEHYGYGRSERGRFDQPEDDRYGRSRRTPYENNWR